VTPLGGFGDTCAKKRLLTTASDGRLGKPAYARRLASRPPEPRIVGTRAVARANGVNHPAIQGALALPPTPKRSRPSEGAIAAEARETPLAWARFDLRHPAGQGLPARKPWPSRGSGNALHQRAKLGGRNP
jgi:hypothetical protein